MAAEPSAVWCHYGDNMEAQQEKDWWERRGRTLAWKRKSGMHECIEVAVAAKRKEIFEGVVATERR